MIDISMNFNDISYVLIFLTLGFIDSAIPKLQVTLSVSQLPVVQALEGCVSKSFCDNNVP